MHIQFIGHSITKQDDTINTFVSQILNHYNCSSSHINEFTGIAMLSEERILKMVKKLTSPDILIIFHGNPNFFYIPTRNFDSVHKSLKQIQADSERLPHIFYPRNEDIVLADKDQYINIFSTYQKYFYDPDNQKDRFAGAVLQIDSYLIKKKFRVIHCLPKLVNWPKWANLTSGIIDYTISTYQDEWYYDDDLNEINNPYAVSYNASANAINQEGNNIITNKLINYIDSLVNQ